jgi:hypothetical protein
MATTSRPASISRLTAPLRFIPAPPVLEGSPG